MYMPRKRGKILLPVCLCFCNMSSTESFSKRRRLGSGVSSCLVSEAQPCPHSVLLNKTCIHCNQVVNDCFGFDFGYILTGLRYSYFEVSRLKKRNTKNLQKQRKLHLVLDLDHTLLHSRKLTKLSSEEKYLMKRVNSLENISDDGSLFYLESLGFLVKLRPYVRKFLEEASAIFEMYVCTMGYRDYALQAAKLLDPDSKYFSSRIIAREDFKQKERKSLNLVLGLESGVVILDDTESVWTDHSDNLITVSRYDYFKGIEDDTSYSEAKTDESESNGTLANMLRVLKTVHGLYFDNPANYIAHGDVRNYLAKVRSGILTGCTVLFTEEFPLFWSRAEEMGAACTTVFDSSVTHVVSLDADAEDCRWAVQENKFLVHPGWINAAYFLWSRQPEDDYLPR